MLDTRCAASAHLLDELRAELRSFQRTSDKPIVLDPGQGSTATRAVAGVLRDGFGLRVSHFPWHLLRLKAPPHEYGKLNWPKLLEPYDALLDVPIPELLPWLLAAFPNARIVHTTREPLDWARSRAVHHSFYPKPLSGLRAPRVDNGIALAHGSSVPLPGPLTAFCDGAWRGAVFSGTTQVCALARLVSFLGRSLGQSLDHLQQCGLRT